MINYIYPIEEAEDVLRKGVIDYLNMLDTRKVIDYKKYIGKESKSDILEFTNGAKIILNFTNRNYEIINGEFSRDGEILDEDILIIPELNIDITITGNNYIIKNIDTLQVVVPHKYESNIRVLSKL